MLAVEPLDAAGLDFVKLLSSVGSTGVLIIIAYMMIRYFPTAAAKLFDTFLQLKEEFYKRHNELCITFTKEQEAQRTATNEQLKREREAYNIELRLEREQCQKQFETLIKAIDAKKGHYES